MQSLLVCWTVWNWRWFFLTLERRLNTIAIFRRDNWKRNLQTICEMCFGKSHFENDICWNILNGQFYALHLGIFSIISLTMNENKWNRTKFRCISWNTLLIHTDVISNLLFLKRKKKYEFIGVWNTNWIGFELEKPQNFTKSIIWKNENIFGISI